VYLARAQKCYRLAELGEESGHRLHFCRNDCRSCAYYRACQGLATEVLIVTGDEALTHRLQNTIDVEVASMRFAASGYESSTIISTFSPALIVLDSGQPEVAGGELLSSVMRDHRIPGARVAVALREGDEVGVADEEILTLRAPFTAEEIESLVVLASGRLAKIPKDVA
jgi:PleD family two-component response regulator